MFALFPFLIFNTVRLQSDACKLINEESALKSNSLIGFVLIISVCKAVLLDTLSAVKPLLEAVIFCKAVLLETSRLVKLLLLTINSSRAVKSAIPVRSEILASERSSVVTVFIYDVGTCPSV